MGKGEIKSLEFLIKKLPWRRKCPREENYGVEIAIRITL